MKTVTIYRDIWGPHTLLGMTENYDDEYNVVGDNIPGTMCCLGFALHQCGAEKDQIEGLAMPSEVAEDAAELSAGALRFANKTGESLVDKRLLRKATKLILDFGGDARLFSEDKYETFLSEINDLYHTANSNSLKKKLAKRVEKVLVELFASIGYELVFEDVAPQRYLKKFA